MKVTVTEEAGYRSAMIGLAKSYDQPVENMPAVAARLAGKGDGHDKFLRQICVWIEIDAPRFWWHEFKEYLVGTAPEDWDTQSESTMHTITRRNLTQDDFEYGLSDDALRTLNIKIGLVRDGMMKIEILKNDIPEGLLQCRVWMANYQTLRAIFDQRSRHRLPQWRYFIEQIRAQVDHPELLPGG